MSRYCRDRNPEGVSYFVFFQCATVRIELRLDNMTLKYELVRVPETTKI